MPSDVGRYEYAVSPDQRVISAGVPDRNFQLTSLGDSARRVGRPPAAVLSPILPCQQDDSAVRRPSRFGPGTCWLPEAQNEACVFAQDGQSVSEMNQKIIAGFGFLRTIQCKVPTLTASFGLIGETLSLSRRSLGRDQEALLVLEPTGSLRRQTMPVFGETTSE